jgi:hypothetical protein
MSLRFTRMFLPKCSLCCSHSSHIFSISLVAQHFIPYPLPKVLLVLANAIVRQMETLYQFILIVSKNFQTIFFGGPTEAYHDNFGITYKFLIKATLLI